MGYDFYLSNRLKTEEQIKDLLEGKGPFSKMEEYTRIALLKQVVDTEHLKNLARSGKTERNRGEVSFKNLMLNGKLAKFVATGLEQMKRMDLLDPKIEIDALPKYSFYLHFQIELAKAVITRDDEPLYIIDNPIRKETVFKVPTIAASTWKGNLRWTLMHLRRVGELEMHDEQFTNLLTVLLGPEQIEKGSDTEALKGRVRFFASFFDRISLDLINPHDRKTKTPRHGPIFIEIIPEGAEGQFAFLYFCKTNGNDAAGALDFLIEGLRALLFKYGFSAKKTSGYGLAREKSLYGQISISQVESNKSFNQLHELQNSDFSSLFT